MKLRLAEDGGPLRSIEVKQGWLAELMGREVRPYAEHKIRRNLAVWLPDERIAKAWTEYVTSGTVSDFTPPPAPTNVGVKGNVIEWDAVADFESGLAGFIIERDGREIARLPEKPVGTFGPALFQALSFHDTPEQPLPEMRFVDSTAKAGVKHDYRVISINTAGLKSAPAHP